MGKLEENLNKNIILYHGSKGGLRGDINHNSRKECDFGSGFYMGTMKEQPLTLIATFDNPILYTLEVDITDLKVYEFNLDLEWALFVAYNRGYMEDYKKTNLYKNFKKINEEYDLLIGYIANDRMFYVLDSFFEGDITDTVLLKALSALKLGRQYVAKTDRACSQIKIIKQEDLSTNQVKHYKQIGEKNRIEGARLAKSMMQKYRRDGKYIDELLGGEF